MNHDKSLVLIFWGEINSNYPKSNRLNLIVRISLILPQIVCDTPITGARTFYTDANKFRPLS